MDELAPTMIRLENVSKTFKLPHEKHTSLKSTLINFGKGKGYERQQVLKNISLNIKQGEFFGVVGRNGSGKSTLLKLLAGIYSPDSGLIEIKGSLTPFIELGVGFNDELTGRENIFLNGALLGFGRREMNNMYDEIVEFSGLKRFMDQKLKNYSSGMQVRLAFSIAIKARSDILLLDEVLAVGDAAFQKKCFDYFRKLKKEKRTVIFISHDMSAVREYCDRAALIDKGQITVLGTPEKVAQSYTRMFLRSASKESTNDDKKRWGSKRISANKVEVSSGEERIKVLVKYKIREDTTNPIFGLTVYSPTGAKIFESNTKWQKMRTGDFKKSETCHVEWTIDNIFTNGENTITVACADADGVEFYDWWDEAATFIVDKDEVTSALTMPKHRIEVNR